MRVNRSIMSVVAFGALIGLSGQAAMAATSTSFLPPVTSARANTPSTTGGTLVALGDSITAGYRLPPSADAFPLLMGNALGESHVENLGVVGATSLDLLKSLSQTQVQADLSQANVVTIDIGSNDILGPAVADLEAHGTLTTTDLSSLYGDIHQFGSNLAKIVAEVHAAAPNAYIVLYNIYNPVPNSGLFASLHTVADKLITGENQVIQQVAAEDGLTVADAYQAIGPHPSQYMDSTPLSGYPFAVHPNEEGHQQLAAAGETALNQEVSAWQTEENKLVGSLPEVPFAGLMPLLGLGAFAGVLLMTRSRYFARRR